MTYSLNLASVIPETTAFPVSVNGTPRSVTSVAISGTKVLLTLSSPVAYGDVITVAYNKSGTKPLQATSGDPAVTITPQAVVNKVLPPNPIYLSSVIEDASPSKLDMTYSLTLANIAPAITSFSVKVNTISRTVNSIAISGSKVSLTLASPVIFGDLVTVAYTKPATNPLQTSAGGQAASITAQNVTNNVSPAIPQYISSVVENSSPSIINVTFNSSLANIVPAAASFNIQINGTSRSITAVNVSGTSVNLTLASPVVYGDIITVAYTKPVTNPLQTPSGGQVATFTAKTVTNNVSPLSPLYVSSLVANTTPSVLEMTYNLVLANIIPVASAFTVMVNSAPRSVSSVTISGTRILLNLSSPVVYGNIVTVSYTKPATNPLQTSSGGQAVTISAQTVTNNVNPVDPVYISSVIENATPSILEITYDLTLANVAPPASAYTVMVNSVARTVSSVAVSGTKVLLSLASPIVYGNVITVAYTKPATNPLQTVSGGQAATFTSKTVTNNVNLVNPVYVSSVIENATPTVLSMTYSLTLANLVPAVSAFTVIVNSVSRTVASVIISGTQVQLTLSSQVNYGDVVTVAYTKPGVNMLQTASGGQAVTITAQNVTNNVYPVSLIYVGSAITNATPSLLEMTYSQTLANIVPDPSAFTVLVNSVSRVVNTVAISGTKVLLTLASPVVYGDVVTVAYTKPALNPIQTLSADEAGSISAKAVTNNVSPDNPEYLSSAIQNSSPSILEMTYDLTLANIIPPASAFTVMVNSVARAVSSVVISGTKILLTLASPVVYGNVVTIAYTKPSINPLQTSFGGQAATITSQPVTNNVNLVNPVYVSSVIENATPSVLEITFDLSLANIVPATSSFSVIVNSTIRPISSVSVSATKVLLTLSSPVSGGDNVTVAYTKPVTNPLQTSSGETATSFTARSVTNNCLTLNAPVVVVDYQTSVYSGFVYEIDASGSYDPNNDMLTFNWTTPANVPVSSTSGPKIRFLSPIVTKSETIEIGLSVSDGTTIQSKNLSINIFPYKPYLAMGKIVIVEASNSFSTDYPIKVIDGNLATKWSMDGDNHWLVFDIENPFKISHLQIAFLPDQNFESYFDIYVSQDKLLWEPVLINAKSCNFSGLFQVFDFPVSKTTTDYNSVKLVGHGNSLNTWNYYSEFKLFGSEGQTTVNPTNKTENIYLYPNPASEVINLVILEPPAEPQTFRIFDFSGKLHS